MTESRFFRRSLAALAVALLLAGCVPTRPGSPVAVRQADGKIEVLYVACTPEKVSTVELVEPADQRHHMVVDSDPVLWAIRYASPAIMTGVAIGEVPEGAEEKVKLVRELMPETYFAVRVTLADNRTKFGAFQAKELGDRVSFYGRYMTADEFARESKCS